MMITTFTTQILNNLPTIRSFSGSSYMFILFFLVRLNRRRAAISDPILILITLRPHKL
jgi:hypothetical protein